MRSSLRVMYCGMVGVLLLAGCSKESDSGESKGTPTTRPAASDKGMPAAGAGKINVYMWSEYIDPEIPKEFEKKTGIKVRVDVYESTEEMVAKLQQAGGVSQYDMVVVSNDAIPQLIALNLIQPLDLAMIPNHKNVAEKFSKPPYDPQCKYTLPYQWGTMGLMYRKDKMPNVDPSWGLIFDAAKQPGPFIMIDTMRDMMGAVLKYQGKSVNTKNPEELKAAGDLILQAKKSKHMLGFQGGVGGKDMVVSGDAMLAIVYNGDAIRAIMEEPKESRKLDFVVPKEGTLIWVDTMVITAKAPNANGAHQFINYILDGEVGAQLSNFNRYATPNAASMSKIEQEDRENPSIYPSEDLMKKMEYLEDVGDATRLYDEIWTAVKSR